MLQNWAGNHTYGASRVRHPRSVEELRDLVGSATRVRALGTRHAFTDLADTTGDLVSTQELGQDIEVDAERRVVRVSGGVSYGVLAEQLARGGWALATMASLPHISVAGAIATGTHGSGDATGSLAAAVAGLEIVGADGALRVVSRGEPDFDGSVVSLGALGVVTHVILDLEPTYEVRQDLYADLPWDVAVEHLDELTSTAYSVSLFTDWVSGGIKQVWLKSRDGVPPADLWGAAPAVETLHMLAGADVEAVTQQGGITGAWHERLPHFRLEFTPSRGEELQSEYLVPRTEARVAVERLRALAPSYAHLLQVGEIRTIAADRLWLSGAYDRDVVGFHFTWVRDVPAVYAVLPAIEEALLPLGGRPHWGKCFAAETAALAPLYKRFEDFRDLAVRVDPQGKFRNDFLARCLELD
ncbi:D-arabinono-1,4-lactone oxidase [Nocardioides sp. URHA0020]|uniref:D-arabinono-1,4-lactone oxidase n=1 Tax=Nocardioides sp. URHA0020 TaxID=1380392 RepID=UPI00048F254A|nr:D-arabinono-1,4-lactone oxidase [Nocardioides sp. URHA0020]